MPTVSVILITHNRAKMLRKAIQSVLEQTYHDYELIIIDDCSTDNTSDIVREFKDKRIHYERLTVNSGGSLKPHQRGLELATGEYIAHLDDDDYWCDKQKLELQVAYFKNNAGCVLVGTQASIADKDGKITDCIHYPLDDNKLRKDMLLQNWFINSSVMYKKESVKIASGYTPFNGCQYINMLDEYTLWIKIGMTGIMANLPINGVALQNTHKVNFKHKVEYMFRQFKRIGQYSYYYGNTSKAYLYNIAITLIEIPMLAPLKNFIKKRVSTYDFSKKKFLKFLAWTIVVISLSFAWMRYAFRNYLYSEDILGFIVLVITGMAIVYCIFPFYDDVKKK